jgi:arylsulfatase A-like enzyme
MTGALARPPDVVVVVMDCARADIFGAEVARGRYTPFLRELRKEAIDFPGAISPGSWTIPSHASLFTGLYPWDHGAHYKSGTTLRGEPETLAAYLGRRGYATASFSANGFIQPAAGLTRGFDSSAWGGDREFFLRFLSPSKPSNPDLGGKEGAAFNRLPDFANPSPFWNSAIALLSKYTVLWDGLNRAGARFLGHPSSDISLVAPWIEPRMEAWFAGVPAERPAFAFVNLLEAHEPYLVEAGQPTSLGRWASYLRDVQGEYVWAQGRWVPTARDLSRSRERYARSFQAVDERIRRIAELLKRVGRWENTLLVLTSDHGQAFLEHDTLYHRFRVEEEITRIPLWVRGPGVADPGGTVDRWVSLIDVPRTVVELMGGEGFGDPSARSLLATDDDAADRPVFAMTDGLLPKEQEELPASRRALLDRLELAVYRGPYKSVVGGSGAPAVFRVSAGEPGAPAVPAPSDDGARDVARLAREAFDRMEAKIAAGPSDGSVLKRLAGWGY